MRFAVGDMVVEALKNVTLAVEPGAHWGVIGESGSGKSTLGLALAGFLRPPGKVAGGRIEIAGEDVFGASPERQRWLRQHLISFIFQNPITTLDPTRRIRDQFFDPESGNLPRPRIRALLESVELSHLEQVLAALPHELSGGMAQRVAIAMCIAKSPRLIVADEPTSALDALVRVQIMTLLTRVCNETGSALLIVSHDLQSVRAFAENVAVMKDGEIVERGPTERIFSAPEHPYTIKLLRAIPGKRAPHADVAREVAP
ncbi:MAG: ABC transporter ATP-binding protein [Pseudomonadota bacterium]|nr:ABC transporter ATP-binding protein [Pseudomonadota bacterium]